MPQTLPTLTDHMPSASVHHYWIFGVVIFLLLILAFTRVFYFHFLEDRIKSYFATRYMKQLIRKELVLYHPYSLITLLLFAMSVSLFFLKTLEVFTPQHLPLFSDYVWFLLGTGVTLVWVIGRALLMKVVQFIIGFDHGQTENRYRIIVFNQVCGYILIPLVSVVFFVKSPIDKWLIFAAAGILALNYLYRIIISLITAFNYQVSLLYLFLYLCTLEFVPLLLLSLTLIRR